MHWYIHMTVHEIPRNETDPISYRFLFFSYLGTCMTFRCAVLFAREGRDRCCVIPESSF